MALTHSRLPNAVMVDISKIRLPEGFVFDEEFQKLLRRAELGSINIGVTRIDENAISSGFYVREAGSIKHVSNLDRRLTNLSVASIRKGERPPVSVYWSPLSPQISKWVCPDDEVTLDAYRELGILSIPCLVYRPKETPGIEACIWCKIQPQISFVRAINPIQCEEYRVFSGAGNNSNFDFLESLQHLCVSTRAAIKKFHRNSKDGPHYHQMLDAVVRRHHTNISATAYHLKKHQYEQAAAIVRMAYEAFLNFYIDWIGPTFFGPRLQLFSYLEAARFQVDNGVNQGLNGFENILGNTANKARLSPLGELFHKASYPPLSSIVHQTYGQLELDAVDFGDGAPRQDLDFLRILTLWMGLITTELLIRVDNEVGLRQPAKCAAD